MELILQINSFINGIVWGPIMLFLLVGTGVYLTVRCGCLQARKFGFMLRSTLGSLFRKTDKASGGQNLTPFQAVSTAREFLYITSPYLAIEDSMMEALCVAADSGVDVRLLMPGTPDHRYTYLAAGAYYDRLLSHGVRLFEYKPGFLHSKLLVADGEMAVVGTINMDYRSFQLHHECGVVLYGMPAVEHVYRDIRSIMEQCGEIRLAQWRKRNIFRRMTESILRIFTIWM